MQNSTGEDKKSGRAWLIAGFISLFCISLFWSVDVSIFYLLSGISVFCFFQYLRSEAKRFQWQQKQSTSYQKQSRPNAMEDFIEEIQRGFKSSGSSFSPKKLVRIMMTLLGLFFVVVFFRVLFSDDVINFSENYYIANDYFDQGEYDSAAYYYRLAAMDNPEDPEIYYGRGNAFLNLNQYDSAIILFDQTLVLDPRHSNALYYKGYTLFQQKKYSEAIEVTSNVLEFIPNDLNAMLLIGDCYYTQTQYEKAMEWYTVVYNGGYRTAILSHVMAYIYDTQGKTAEAIEFYKEALELDNTKVEIYSRLGELLPGEEGNAYRAKALEYSSGK